MTVKLLSDGLDNDLIVSLNWIHERIHAGEYFSFSEAIDFANSATRNILIKTPNSTDEIHFFYLINSETETDILFFEAPTVTDVETELTPFNRYREVVSVPTTKIYHTPTTTADGVQLEHKHMGSGKQSGGDTRTSEEIILKENTYYLLRIKNESVSTNYIATEISWYKILEN